MDFEHPPADPVAQLHRWLEDARGTDLPNPTSMSLATVDPDGRPAARIVLLRGLDEQGAVFYTNYGSRKGRSIEQEPRVALLLHWDPLERQVRIEGPATRCSPEESDAYFAGRPRPSRIGAWASDQSSPLASREALERAVLEAAERFAGGEVPRPPYWGGYRVGLRRIEFWQGHPFRLHDRIVYERPTDEAPWTITRLAP